MSNIHGSLILNATAMQDMLLQFSDELSTLSLKSLEDQSSFNVTNVVINDSTNAPTFTIGPSSDLEYFSQVKITFSNVTELPNNMYVAIRSDGVPAYISTTQMSSSSTGTSLATPLSPTTPEDQRKLVAISMAVVAMNLLGVGVSTGEIKTIFENGITPTSLAAVESQLKGHHDAVLQLALECLSRVTNILQKIAQKLSS